MRDRSTGVDPASGTACCLAGHVTLAALGAVPPPDAFGPGLVILLLVVAAVVVGVLVWRHQQRLRSDLARLAERDGLRTTETPLGFSAGDLAGRFVATPRGDRHYGLEYAVAGPLTVALDGGDRTLDCAAFRWWSEERRTSQDGQGRTTTSYERQRESVAIVRLPAHVPDLLVVRPESVFGQVWITRGGQQLESAEFNRRFRGRSIEVTAGTLVLGGKASRREPGLAGFVGELPVLRDDARRLLAAVPAVPAAFWRAVGLPTDSPSDRRSPDRPSDRFSDRPPEPPTPPGPV